MRLAFAPVSAQPFAAPSWQPGVRAAIAYARTHARGVSFAVRTQLKPAGS